MEAMRMDDRIETIERNFGPAQTISVVRTISGWFQELLLGCDSAEEFHWFDTTHRFGQRRHFATSREDSSCCLRILCPGCRPFRMTVREISGYGAFGGGGEGREIFTIHRPCSLPSHPCKCCCHQRMEFVSEGRKLGEISEGCYVCVPRMTIWDGHGRRLFKVHSPTCCGGLCLNYCTEGNPCCGRGCFRLPYHIFPASQIYTDDGAHPIGKIVKVPKSLFQELFTNFEAYEVVFPGSGQCNNTEKALIAGSAVFMNANFFEDNPEESGAQIAEGYVLNSPAIAGLI